MSRDEYLGAFPKLSKCRVFLSSKPPRFYNNRMPTPATAPNFVTVQNLDKANMAQSQNSINVALARQTCIVSLIALHPDALPDITKEGAGAIIAAVEATLDQNSPQNIQVSTLLNA